MKETSHHKTPTPAKAGLIYGKFTPSPLGTIVTVTADGKKKRFHANRKERRHGQFLS